MKKIINKKMYNTSTAEKIVEVVNNLQTNDYSWEKEVVYLTKNGRWISYGEGGQISKYSCKNGDVDIIPLSEKEI